MIYLEQAGQPSRVILTELQAVDQPQQPFQQGMTAPEETGGYGTNAAAEPGLFPGRPHRLPVCPVEGAGDPADLVGGPHVDRRDRDKMPGVPGHVQRADFRGQACPGHVRGRRFGPSQRAHQRSGHDHGGQQDNCQDGQRHAAGDYRGPHRGPLQGLGVGGDPGRQLLLGMARPADREGHPGLPLLAGLRTEG